MSLVGGSVVQLTNSRPAHVVLVDANGDPLFGSTTSSTLGSTATISSQPASSSSVVLKAANPNRKSLRIQNESQKSLRVAYSATATSAVFTTLIPAGGSQFFADYTGIVSGIWDNNPNGAAVITEVV